MKNKLIDSLQKQLEAIRAADLAAVRTDTPPPPQAPTQLGIEDVPTVRCSLDDDLDQEDDNDSVARYFARSASGGSFVYRSPTSPFDCPSVDAMLFDFSAEEEATAQTSETVLNPQPLWQLEFGSAWERIQKNVIRHNQSPKTSNPRDLVIDFGESSSSNSGNQTETDDEDDNVFHSAVAVAPTSSRNPFRKSFTVTFF